MTPDSKIPKAHDGREKAAGHPLRLGPLLRLSRPGLSKYQLPDSPTRRNEYKIPAIKK